MIWNCKDKKIEYGKKTLLMGIINVTPDSFSDGGDNFGVENAVSHAKELIKDGADILDFGAQSTRPGYSEISPEEEWARLKDVITEVRKETNIPISIDTYFPYVAEKSLSFGADIINDVSGVVSKEMAEIVKKEGAGWILMHSVDGGPLEVHEFFEKAVKTAENFGIEKSHICLDMGIGFKKTRENDLKLISNIKEYKKDGFPLLLATSRKRVIGLGSGESNPKLRTYGNIAADTVAIFGGADIIRLHDVKNEKQGIMMAELLKENYYD